jgi:hypothetical protein
LAYLTPDLERLPAFRTVESETGGKRILVGPLNELSLLDNPEPTPFNSCGPWETEEEFLRCRTWGGGARPAQSIPLKDKLLEMFAIVKPITHIESPIKMPEGEECQLFHFCHGDLSYSNILVDNETGSITGILDREASGFYPPWLACRNETYLNDDSCRFVVSEGQHEPEGYDDNVRNEVTK